MSQSIKVILTDIEGTTSAISFVKDVLFPYAYKNLPDYVFDHRGEKEVAAVLDAVKEEEKNPDLTIEEVVEVLLRYIDEDRKITCLKTLQGMIWEHGYKDGVLKGHVYDDAVAGLKRWSSMGLRLYVYSSGSVPAQKLLFSNTPAGDLTPLFSGYFDTTIGGKKETRSYEKIADEIGVDPEEILFLSDSTEEIVAAGDAGMHVIILDREKVLFDALGYEKAADFDYILLDESVNA